MDSAAGEDGRRNVGPDCIDPIEIPNIRASSAIIRAHRNDWQALRLLSANGELRSLYARFGAAKIGAGPHRFFRGSLPRDAGKRMVSQRITQFEILIDG